MDQYSQINNHVKLPIIQDVTLKHKAAEIFRKRPYLSRSYIYHPRDKRYRSLTVNKKDMSRESNTRWFYKPNYGRGTMGIKISKFLGELFQIAKNNGEGAVIQKEVDNLLLYEKKKFEIRMYVLATVIPNSENIPVLNFYLYQEGHAILALKSFKPNSTNRGHVFTNRSFVSQEQIAEGKHQVLISDLPNSTEIMQNIFRTSQDIVKIMKFRTSNKNLEKITKPSYEILAFDFLIDQNYQPWLTEINKNPCVKLKKDIPSVQQQKINLYHNIIHFLIEPLLSKNSNTTIAPQLGKFRLL